MLHVSITWTPFGMFESNQTAPKLGITPPCCSRWDLVIEGFTVRTRFVLKIRVFATGGMFFESNGEFGQLRGANGMARRVPQ